MDSQGLKHMRMYVYAYALVYPNMYGTVRYKEKLVSTTHTHTQTHMHTQVQPPPTEQVRMVTPFNRLVGSVMVTTTRVRICMPALRKHATLARTCLAIMHHESRQQHTHT